MFRILASLFALSGVSGLIYESVWSHYIKLILGHAAYAQTLVLAIFMGGMAVGAWVASRAGTPLRNLLKTYALVEAVIGVFALVFHPTFEASSALLLDHILPALEPGWQTSTAKLLFASLLILPQSLLLGATFPLMTGGVMRRIPTGAGATVSLLYFANSIGAVAGVLWSGFWLIPRFGLPGTLAAAGGINLALAAVVFFIAVSRDETPYAAPTPEAREAPGALTWVLWAAAITGAASFCYEIAWIRMLSMVLGASTHSFELMLAAFILGIALGGAWMRRRIDSIASPRRFLGLVQIAMGSFAVLTLPLYNLSFDLMAGALSGLARSDTGYALFSFFGHGIALFIMLPATFCAGMTLPLLTLILLRAGRGERAIGQVYAANTLGAIVGVLIAVHVALPLVQLKGLMLFGTLLDGVLGIWLIAGVIERRSMFAKHGAALFFLALWTGCVAAAELDPRRMGGGVYRYGNAALSERVEVLSFRDGKTASIAVVRDTTGRVVISTNGKPDASINMSDHGDALPDEVTMTLAGIVPLLYKPDAAIAANIGFGSGMSTHTLLAFPQVHALDNIEIEPRMVEGARLGFEKRIPRAFNDPRSEVRIDDARAYFSSRGKRYDVIVSEPSNPWVSGVSSLFSQEFYRHVVRYLAPDGVFVQWLQLYETGMPVVASITKALDQSFEDYAVYAADDYDLLIVARAKGHLPTPQPQVLAAPAVREAMDRAGLKGAADIDLRLLANKAVWSPLFASVPAPANSDFRPFVDHEAPRLRFIGSSAQELISLGMPLVPVLEALGARSAPPDNASVGGDSAFEAATLAAQAQAIRELLRGVPNVAVPQDVIGELAALQAGGNCAETEGLRLDAMHTLARRVVPYLSPADLRGVWAHALGTVRCLDASEKSRDWRDLIIALSARDFVAAGAPAERRLAALDRITDARMIQTLIVASLSAQLVAGDEQGFTRIVDGPLRRTLNEKRLPPTLAIEVLLAQAKARGWLRHAGDA